MRSRSSRSRRAPFASSGREAPTRPVGRLAAGLVARRPLVPRAGERGDGKRFVRIDAATGDVVDIAPMYHLADPGAHWSPDSRRFAYARPDDCGGNPPCQSSIVVEDADLTNARSRSPIPRSSPGARSGLPTAPGSPSDPPRCSFARDQGPGPQVSAAHAVDRSARRPRPPGIAQRRPPGTSPGAPMVARSTCTRSTGRPGWASGCPKSASAMGLGRRSPRRRTSVAMTGNRSQRSSPSPRCRPVPSPR